MGHIGLFTKPPILDAHKPNELSEAAAGQIDEYVSKFGFCIFNFFAKCKEVLH